MIHPHHHVNNLTCRQMSLLNHTENLCIYTSAKRLNKSRENKTMNLFKSALGFSKKNKLVPLPIPVRDSMISLIVHKQVQDYLSYLRQKDYQLVCIDAFFHLLPTIFDDVYMSDLFQLIVKKSRFSSDQLSKIVHNQLSRTILEKDFQLCEKILRLPLQTLKISLPTYELTQLIHTCSNTQQLTDCLSILIEKNLPHDPEYISWILIILFEHYRPGDEVIIEHLLNIKKNSNFLFTSYGTNQVTPLMLFLHLYSNSQCQLLLEQCLSNIHDLSILLQCDKWNRSYLMHLLCARCEHDIDENSNDRNQCPQASVVLARFSMLYKLGNSCETPVKKILTSEFCLPLRMMLLDYYLENNPSVDVGVDELFHHFPARFLSIYTNDLKRLIRNRNLDAVLVSQICNLRADDHSVDSKVKFLLQQGARLQKTDAIHSVIFNLIVNTRSMIPFTLLDYSFSIDIPFDVWVNQNSPRVNLYICCVVQYGYPCELRKHFDVFKSRFPDRIVKVIENLVDARTPARLSNLCLQKLRISLKDLGDTTIEQLQNDLPIYLRKWIVCYGHAQLQAYFP